MPSALRPPAVAGQFYSADGAALAREVEACFTDPRGPGHLPTRTRTADRRLLAAVVPHAGYPFSGPIAAHAYARIAAERPPASVLVLGVDHHGRSRGAALSGRAWETPIGPTAIDDDLVRALSQPPLGVDEEAHALEHSIEVQLPFLEYVLPKPRVVPLEIAFDSFARLERVAEVVRRAIEGRDVLLLASTDFSHYIPAATAERLDRMAIDAILGGDARTLYDTVAREEISMCGIAPTTVLLSVLAGRPRRAELLRWGHSGEAARMRDVVGYAAIVLSEAGPGRPSVK
ncbi:MAG TPA: AmmeMemoRadiSam system protein B [Thermoplasmata archaeon]|nr:AmmeMemoRadiSam system protein B [Thermoplasmata archaeon]